MAPRTLPPLSSYSTALVLLPPPHIQTLINPLRSANDKSFPRWTSHLTLVFPFVELDSLSTACSLIRDALSEANISPFPFKLDKVEKFNQRDYDTVYLGPSQASDVHRVWNVVSSAVGYSGRAFVPHLTLGQANHRDHPLPFLQDKGRLLLEQAIQWDLSSVVVLRKSDVEGGLMKIYDEIALSLESPPSIKAVVTGLRPTTYRFGPESWMPSVPVTSHPRTATLATYNVLHDSNHPTTSRLPRVLSAVIAVQPIPDVLCLQEVTDEFLRHVLADTDIRARWPWCTHDPTGVLPNERNIVFLASEAFGFTWEFVQLRKHKPAAVLRIPCHEAEPLVIAGVHLTAGLESSQQHTKMDELNRLIAFLQQCFIASPWIIIGDFNIPTFQPVPSSIVDTFDDVWLSFHGSEDEGATYDPSSNTLATKTAKQDHSPQRYDRIWVRRNVGMRVETVEKFGQANGEASDHYGLTTSLSFSVIDPAERLEVLVPNLPRAVCGTAESATAISDDQLEKIVRQDGGYASQDQHDDRARVIATLRTVLSLPTRPVVDVDSQPPELVSDSAPSQSVVRFNFIPVGSFGLGVDTQDSDVDVLVVGNIPPRTFWSLIRTLLRRAASKSRARDGVATDKETFSSVTLKRFVKDASVPMMELVVGNVRVDMQYCSAGKLLDSWDQVHTLPPTDPSFLLPAPSLRTLNAYRNLLAVLRVLPATFLTAFRLAHRALKLYCISHGIYSSRLGYLGGIHLTLLLTRITLLSSPGSSAMQLIHTFFATYANWDWAQHAVTIPGVNDTSTYTRAVGREPMVILTIEKPVLNVVQNANQHSLQAIISSFKSSHRLLAEGFSWLDICRPGGLCGNTFKTDFLYYHGSYIKLDLLFWGSSAAKARAWISYVESRLPHLLVLLRTSLPNWSVRLWPARLVDASNPGHPSTGLQSFYLLGFDAPMNPTSGKKIQAPLLAFEDGLRRNERFYDSTEMFVSVTQVGPSQLPENITTPLAWLDGGIDPDDDTSDEEEAEELPDEDRDSDAAFAPISSKQAKKNRPPQLKGSNTPHVPAPKLRTSSDVYHRILWDRELDTEGYLIGYEDRFSGLKEMPLTHWKRDVEHEDFVPFHRVMHFRRKSDGVLVWNRRHKVDMVFGSGVQQSSS